MFFDGTTQNHPKLHRFTAMRARYQPQLQIGQVSIENIQFDPRSRDDIPKLLKGLQHIYCNKEIREAVFKILEEDIGETRSLKNGRPGLELWKILVMGVLRLSLDLNYDRLHEMVNSHREIRQMLGHSDWMDKNRYVLQTIKDNVNLFTEKTLIKINDIVVKEGHKLLKKKKSKRGVIHLL